MIYELQLVDFNVCSQTMDMTGEMILSYVNGSRCLLN